MPKFVVVDPSELGFGNFTAGKRYPVQKEGYHGKDFKKENADGRTFFVIDDSGKELAIFESYCREIVDE